jgi:parvulin-like peptidyl-prolyl isomerase
MLCRAAFTLITAGLVWPHAAAFGSSKPIAVVNGEAIPRSELDAVLKLRPQAVIPLTSAQQRQMYEQVVALLVDEVLLRQFLAKHTPPADPARVEQQFSALVEALKAQGKSVADYCKESQQTERQVRANIDHMLRWNAHVAKTVTEAELQKYYSETKDFFDKVTVRCSHIVVRVPPEAKPAERADSERRLRELRGQIVAGKTTFAEAAKNYSHCPSAPKGGDLGYIFRKWMVEEPFARAAFALKVNEISDVVTTDFGLHLVLVTDRKPPEPSEFAKVKDEVRDCYTEEMRLKVITDLRKTAKIEMNLP